jgi:DNA-binding CsgD family transcriptional regulator
MARTRTAVVTGNLEPIEERYRGRPEQIRIRALRLLQEDPARTHRDVAELLGVSKVTVDRWWGIYRKSGIEGLLALRMTPAGTARQSPPVAASAVEPARAARSLPDSDALIRLMNSLPLSLDVADAITVLRGELMAILPDVDRVVISVDTACDLANPELYRPTLDVIQDATSRETARRRVHVREFSAEKSSMEALLQLLRRQGYPIDDYHPPEFFELTYEQQAPLGTIFLWRELSKPPISQSTRNLLERLIPFLIYALSNIVARHQYRSPGDRIFRNALEQMSNECSLTPQERRVVTYRLYGHSYKVIAAELEVSEDTVKKHLGSVHRKTKTAGHAELFAKYFSPLIVPSGRGTT